MEIFRFLAWLWNKTELPIKVMFGIVLFFISIILVGSFFGPKGLTIYLSLILLLCVLALIVVLCMAIKIQWEKYKIFKAEEAETIINRLKGAK